MGGTPPATVAVAPADRGADRGADPAPPETAGRGSRSWIVVGVAFLVACVGRMVWIGFGLQDSLFVDIGVYRMGGRALLDQVPLYDTAYEINALPFTYTPFAAMVFVPIAMLKKDAAIVVWTIVNFACLARISWLVARAAGPRLRWPVPVSVVAPGLFLLGTFFEPVESTLSFGQVNLFLTWLVLEDLLARRPRWFTGVGLGLATGIKLVPGIFIVYLLLVRRWKAATIAAGTAALTVAAGFLVQPDQAYRYWFDGIGFDPARVGGVAYTSNQSFNGVITRLTQPGGNRMVWLALVLPTAVLCLWAARRLWRGGLPLTSIAMVAIAQLLVSPVSWSHHFVWTVVVLGSVAELVAARSSWHGLWAVVLVPLMILGPIWWVPNEGDLEYRHTWPERLVGNSYAIFLVLFVLAVAWTARSLPALGTVREHERDGDHHTALA